MALTRDALIQYIQDEMGADLTGFADDTPLVSTNVVDSFGLVDLVMFIEQQAGIKVGATELNLDNLDSIERILNFVARKSG